MNKAKIDWIQFGILLISGLCMLGGAIGWSITTFAQKDNVNDLKARVEKIEALPSDVAVIKEEVHEINKKLDRHWR